MPLPTKAKITALVCNGRIRPNDVHSTERNPGITNWSAAQSPTSMPTAPQRMVTNRKSFTMRLSYWKRSVPLLESNSFSDMGSGLWFGVRPLLRSTGCGLVQDADSGGAVILELPGAGRPEEGPEEECSHQGACRDQEEDDAHQCAEGPA